MRDVAPFNLCLTTESEGLGAAAEGGQSGVVKAGDGRESPPSSPRLRQTTFGATLDFIEALCDASSRLTSFPPVRAPYSPFTLQPCPLDCIEYLCKLSTLSPPVQLLYTGYSTFGAMLDFIEASAMHTTCLTRLLLRGSVSKGHTSLQ